MQASIAWCGSKIEIVISRVVRGVMAVPDCLALHSSMDEESLIKRYFENGYTYKDIRAFLETKHGPGSCCQKINYVVD